MFGIYLLFFVGTICLLVVGVKRNNSGQLVLLDKNDTNYLKGLATIGVFLAHACSLLEEMAKGGKALKVFSSMGGCGVLLFFFLGGYGIYKGYSEKKPSINYWKNRIVNVLVPALMISLSLTLIIDIIGDFDTSFLKEIHNIILRQWYIDVVIIEYLVFYICWSISKKNTKMIVPLSLALSLAVAFLFWVLGMDSRWYNGLFLFPIGMLLAKHEKKILELKTSIKIIIIIFSWISFFSLGYIFTFFKGLLFADFLKTISGISLAVAISMTFYFIKFGNKAVNWIGRRSLFFYLCHLYVIYFIKDIGLSLNIFINKGHQELWIYILVIMSIILSEFFYIICRLNQKIIS